MFGYIENSFYLKGNSMTSGVSNHINHQTIINKQTQQTQDEKVTKTAKDFEAMTISQLLTPMIESNDDEEDMMGTGSSAEKQFRSLQIQELGKQISNAGGIGIAKSVYSKMKEMQEASHKTRIVDTKK